MIRAFLVDDERKSSLTLQKLLEKYCTDFEVLGNAQSIGDAVELIIEKDPDVVFLDIEMGDGTGFDLLSMFDDPFFQIVFVTAHSDYAVKAFKFSAVDYLLKPVDIDDLKNAAIKIRKAIRTEITFKQQSPTPGQQIKLSTKKGHIFISTDEVIRLQASGNYTEITLLNKEKHLISGNLGVLEEKIKDENFVRVHRSDIVNINHITRIVKEVHCFVELAGYLRVEISRRNRRILFKALTINKKL
jgi:two-component system, LytTR family, response regulator